MKENVRYSLAALIGNNNIRPNESELIMKSCSEMLKGDIFLIKPGTAINFPSRAKKFPEVPLITLCTMVATGIFSYLCSKLFAD